MCAANHGETISVFTDPRTPARKALYGDGTVIYDLDTEATHVHYILEGVVYLYISGPGASLRLINIKGPGTWVGAGAIAGNPAFGMRAVAGPGTIVREIAIADFWASISSRPKDLVDLARQLAGKFVAALDDGASLVFQDSNERLLHALLRFGESAVSSPHPQGVSVRMTHEQLAQAVGVARETVSLGLTQLRQKKLLQTGRNRVIFDPAALRKFVLSRPNTLAAAVDE